MTHAADAAAWVMRPDANKTRGREERDFSSNFSQTCPGSIRMRSDARTMSPCTCRAAEARSTRRRRQIRCALFHTAVSNAAWNTGCSFSLSALPLLGRSIFSLRILVETRQRIDGPVFHRGEDVIGLIPRVVVCSPGEARASAGRVVRAQYNRRLLSRRLLPFFSFLSAT